MSPSRKVYFLTISDDEMFGGIETVIACYTDEVDVDHEIKFLKQNYPQYGEVYKRELNLNDPNKNSLYFYDFEHYYGPVEQYPEQAFDVRVVNYRDDGNTNVIFLVCEMILDEPDVLVACPKLTHAIEVAKRFGEPPETKAITKYAGELYVKCFYLDEKVSYFRKTRDHVLQYEMDP
jgi:hypothetical protein